MKKYGWQAAASSRQHKIPPTRLALLAWRAGLPPFSKGGNLLKTQQKSPFCKGGFRGILGELVVKFFESPLTTNPATDYVQLTTYTARFESKKTDKHWTRLQFSEYRSRLQHCSLRSLEAGDGSLECGFSPEKIHFIFPLFKTLLSPFPGSPRPFQINICGAFSCCGQYGHLGG